MYAEIVHQGKLLGRSYNLADTVELAFTTDQIEAVRKMVKTVGRVMVKEAIADAVERNHNEAARGAGALCFDRPAGTAGYPAVGNAAAVAPGGARPLPSGPGQFRRRAENLQRGHRADNSRRQAHHAAAKYVRILLPGYRPHAERCKESSKGPLTRTWYE